MQGTELRSFEQIIDRDINGLIVQHLPLTKHYVRLFTDSLTEETEYVKSRIAFSAARYRDENRLQSYIQFHQQHILLLLSQLGQYVSPASVIKKTNKLDHVVICQTVYGSLEDLLQFIQDHYHDYLDWSAWIPKRYSLLVRHEITLSLRDIEHGLEAQSLPPTLKDLALAPFYEITQAVSHRSLTYQRLLYLKDLKHELTGFIRTTHPSPSFALMSILFKLNYNSEQYLEYNIKLIKDEIDAIADVIEQLGRLALVQKSILQRAVKNGLGYDHESQSLKDALSAWIKAEIAYTKIVAVVKDGNANTPLPKVKLNLSSEEILYICFVNAELGVVEYSDVTTLVKGLASSVKTRRQSNLSWESMRTKFYKAESSTIKSVLLFLKKMIEFINKNSGLE